MVKIKVRIFILFILLASALAVAWIVMKRPPREAAPKLDATGMLSEESEEGFERAYEKRPLFFPTTSGLIPSSRLSGGTTPGICQIPPAGATVISSPSSEEVSVLEFPRGSLNGGQTRFTSHTSH